MKLSSTTTALIFSLCLAVAASSAAAEMTKSYANSRRLQSETNEAYNPFNMNHSSPEFRYDYLYLEAQCQEKSDALDACLEDSCNSCQPLMLVNGISKVPDFCTAFVHKLCFYAAGVLRCCKEIQTQTTDTTKPRRIYCHEELEQLQNCYTVEASCSLTQVTRTNVTCDIYEGLPANSNSASRRKSQWSCFGVFVTFSLVVWWELFGMTR